MSDFTATESTPLHSVTLTTTAKGIITYAVTVYDADVDVAATKATAVLARLRAAEQAHIVANPVEFYNKGA